jgi:outer membrane receptor protein involved in Fe transport
MGQRIRLALFGLALLLPASALAQRTTGIVAGTVKDESGAALPGATVAVSGPNIVGAQTAVTNQNGFYRLPNLPPGSYQLSFSFTGFTTLTRTGVRVSVGGTTEETAMLAISTLAEQVEVVASAQVVDTSTNQISTNYERSWIESAPLRRYSFLDLAAAAPGSLGGGDNHFRPSLLLAYGSSQDENSFQLDGGSITDRLGGFAYLKPNVDAIEEVQVLPLGAPAEYGGVTGAVYNVVTRQGTNEFHGEANLFLQTAGLTGNNTGGYPPLADGAFVDSCPSDSTRHCPFERETFNELTLQLGGPVLKDKLWLFASYQRQKDEFSAAGSEPPPTVDNGNRTDSYLFKLNYQLNPRHKLQGTFHFDDERFPFVFPANWAPSTAVVFENTKPTPGLSYTGVLSDKTVLEVRYSGFYGNMKVGPLDPDQPRDLPAIYNLDTGYHSGGWGYWYEFDRNLSAVDARLSHFSDDFLGGSHDFRFGVQYHDSQSAAVIEGGPFISVYYMNGLSYGYGGGTRTLSYSGDVRRIGAFVDDTFRVNDRLSLNLGLRFDHEKAFAREHDLVDDEGQPTGVRVPQQDLFAWDTLSPRLGFNWKLTADGKTALRGHWGRYHPGILVGAWAAGVAPHTSYNGLLIPGTLELTDLVVTEETDPGFAIDPYYAAPRSDQFILSLERELARDFGVQATYVYKRGRRYALNRVVGGIYNEVGYLDDQGADATGRPITVYQLQNELSDLSSFLTNGSEMDKEVHAASLVLLKRLSGNWYLNGSLTWQRTSGRATGAGHAASSLFQFSQPGGGSPNDFVNTGGRLAGDVPLQMKVQCLYRFPRDFSASLSFSHRGGAHLVRLVRVGDITNLPGTTVYGEKRGRLGRLPAITQLDLRVQKDFRLGERVASACSPTCSTS